MNALYFIPLGICTALLCERFRTLKPHLGWLRPEWPTAILIYLQVSSLIWIQEGGAALLDASLLLLGIVTLSHLLRRDKIAVKVFSGLVSLLLLVIAMRGGLPHFDKSQMVSAAVPATLGIISIVIPFQRKFSARIANNVAVIMLWISWILAAQFLSAVSESWGGWKVILDLLSAVGFGAFFSWAYGRYLEAAYLRDNVYLPLKQLYSRALLEGAGRQRKQVCRAVSGQCERCQADDCRLVESFTDLLLEQSFQESLEVRTTIHRLDMEVKNLSKKPGQVMLSDVGPERALLSGYESLRLARGRTILSRSLRKQIDDELVKLADFLRQRNRETFEGRMGFVRAQTERIMNITDKSNKEANAGKTALRKVVKYLLECDRGLSESLYTDQDAANHEQLSGFIEQHSALYSSILHH